jgi:hypothetical protein
MIGSVSDCAEKGRAVLGCFVRLSEDSHGDVGNAMLRSSKFCEAVNQSVRSPINGSNVLAI